MSLSPKVTIDQLRQLVSTPSVSSAGPGWDQGNRAVIDLLAGWLEQMAFNVEIPPGTAAGDKVNLIATRGNSQGGLLL